MWIAYIIFALPLFLLSFFKEKYKFSLKARFFLYKNLHQSLADVHFHACSLGEVRSIKDLALSFNSRISVITQTGFNEALSFCKKVNFLAFENFIPFCFKPCKVLVIFEAEYWLMLVFIAKFKGAKVLLINARISDKSYKAYKKFAFFYRLIFHYIDEVFAQSLKDKERLLELGAKNVTIFPNIKAALKPKISKNYKKFAQKLIIFANTHSKEEELLLRFFTLKKDEKLIIAPRHPQRFKEVENLLLSLNLDFNKFSDFKEGDLEHNFTKQILLLDALGELVNFYAISDVVVLGGSFLEGIGGHNPIEAANFENVLISGVFIHNQKSLFEVLENVNFCENLEELDAKIHNLSEKTRISKNTSLKPIIKLIQEAIDARKSL